MRMSDSCGRRRRNTYMEVPEHIIPKWQNSGQYIEERSESAYPLIFEFGQMLFEIDLLVGFFVVRLLTSFSCFLVNVVSLF